MQKHIRSLLVNKQLFKLGFYAFSVFVLYGTLSPAKSLEPRFFTFLKFQGADKVIHLGMFFVLTVCFFLAYKVKFIKSILILSVYGVVIEILQEVFPNGRTFDFYDIIFNVFGAIIGYLFISNIYRRLILK